MQSKKKKLGQFFTEPTIAKFMVKLVLKNDSHDVLDPAVGMGAFTEILSKENPDFAIADCSRSALKNSSGISKVASWVRNSKGSVRIILPRYGKTDFDVTLPTFLSQKVPNSGQSKSKGTQKKSTKRPTRRK